MKGGRDIRFDIAKGIAISLIVFGHIRDAGTPAALGGAISFVNYFHVAVFFVISGWFCLPERDWGCYVWKKMKRLALPYLCANAILLIFDFVLVNVLTGNTGECSLLSLFRMLVGVDTARLAIPTWFLMTLLYVALLYKLIYNLFKNEPLYSLTACLAISVLCYFIQNETSISGMVFITRTTMSLGYFALGHYLSVRAGLRRDSCGTHADEAACAISLSVLFVLFFAVRYRVSFYWLKGYNLFLTYLAGAAGTMMVMSLSGIVASRTVRLKKLFDHVGKGSMYILIGHYPVFLLVTALQAAIKNADIRIITTSICPEPGHGWWMAYLVSGIVLPLAVKAFAGHLKK